ncbi:hypothetical protein MXD59_02630 [Frankia sp. Ag45/Mut15]|uniref:Mercuric ion transport protein n=1 Tax=Frankia umida TaxID=573489 RepID=A0ABT0JT20_9ACTN|nr:hypothetical protein [Frankia umida]MCK9874687.1 hypothetical protein [Frankia umida]
MNPAASATRRSRPWSTIGTAAAAVAACAVCCAGPLLAVLGAVGATATIAAVWIPALAFVALAALLGAVMVRRRRAACQAGTGPVDLDPPTLRHHRDPATPTSR